MSDIPMPLFYYCRKIKGGVESHKEAIKQRISRSPTDQQAVVAKNYENMWLQHGTKVANKYLENVYQKLRVK